MIQKNAQPQKLVFTNRRAVPKLPANIAANMAAKQLLLQLKAQCA
jgi:hypothetical protein